MRAWLRPYAAKHPCHGFRRAWAALRFDERREVNKKILRLWREKGLRVKVNSPRKRAGVSSIPPVDADAPNVVWATDFQFDSTIDGKAIKIASMLDEHTCESLLHVVERSITAERLVIELEDAFDAAGGPPKVLRMDNGPELVSQALQRFCENKVGLLYIPPGTPWNNGYIESFNNRLRKECLNRNHGKGRDSQSLASPVPAVEASATYWTYRCSISPIFSSAPSGPAQSNGPARNRSRAARSASTSWSSAGLEFGVTITN